MTHAPDNRHATGVHHRTRDRLPARHAGPFLLVSLAVSLLLAAALAGCGGAGAADRGGGTTEPDPAPTTGALAMTTVTNGAELDTDGYTVAIDGGTAQAIASAGSLVVGSLNAGTHAVELGGVAANCAVDDGATRTPSVTAGDTTAVAFAVSCSATTGALLVTTTTTGSDLDADGYAIALDGAAAQPIATTDSLFFPGLALGSHAIALGGLAANCTLAGGAVQTVTVMAGDTVAVALTVTCVAVTGALTVITTTDDATIDPDGYEVILADSTTSPGGADFSIWGDSTVGRVGTDGSTTFTGLQPGNHVILLGGQSDGCGVASGPPLVIPVTTGDTTSVNYDVNCGSPEFFGNLEIRTNTTGFNIDPDGYAFAVTFSEEQDIGTNDAVTISRSIGSGSAVVWLRGVAANCTVAGTNVQVADVLQAATTTVTFDVTCGSDP